MRIAGVPVRPLCITFRSPARDVPIPREAARVVSGVHVAALPLPSLGQLPGTARGGEIAAHDRSLLVAERAEVDVAMERYAAGDDAAYAAVYDALAPRLYGYLVRQTRESARAEDILQQTLLQIHRARSSFIPGAEVMPWAFAIARRLLVDSVRRGRRELLSADGEPDPGASKDPTADEIVQAHQLARRLEAELQKLPPAQRVAFELVKNEGLSMAEAAQVLGTTVAAVKLRAHRAYEALRLALGDVIGPIEEGR